MRYNEFKRAHGRSARDYHIAVSAVDNPDARREIATDLPRVVIDGATGGLMIALMRGEDPANSCVSCTYAEIVTDEDGVWARRLGTSRERIQQLRIGTLTFDTDVLKAAREHGTILSVLTTRRSSEAMAGSTWSAPNVEAQRTATCHPAVSRT